MTFHALTDSRNNVSDDVYEHNMAWLVFPVKRLLTGHSQKWRKHNPKHNFKNFSANGFSRWNVWGWVGHCVEKSIDTVKEDDGLTSLIYSTGASKQANCFTDFPDL